jgi:hypothetical protein
MECQGMEECLFHAREEESCMEERKEGMGPFERMTRSWDERISGSYCV